jgi:arginine deiminase
MSRTAAAAYGGSQWQPRLTSHMEEIGTLWAGHGIRSEWEPLRAVLLHRPGAELAGVEDPDASLMLEIPDPARAAEQHERMAEAYRSHGVEVHFVDPPGTPSPNQMFVADLMLMTPGGAIVARPASAARAGEERWVARRLADLGVPILRTLSGNATFEGADAMWLDAEHVLIGRGLRTNPEGARQVAEALTSVGATSIHVDLPHGSMHLMGQVRIVDRDLAFIQRGRTPWSAVHALRDHGFAVHFFPNEEEIREGFAHNFVTLGPRKILMPAGNPASHDAYEELGISCVTVDVGELAKAAGAIGCLSGVLNRG